MAYYGSLAAVSMGQKKTPAPRPALSQEFLLLFDPKIPLLWRAEIDLNFKHPSREHMNLDFWILIAGSSTILNTVEAQNLYQSHSPQTQKTWDFHGIFLEIQDFMQLSGPQEQPLLKKIWVSQSLGCSWATAESASITALPKAALATSGLNWKNEEFSGMFRTLLETNMRVNMGKE